MPVAYVNSKGEPFEIWYDVYGLEATEADDAGRPPGERLRPFEPDARNHGSSAPSVDARAASAGVLCTCLSDTGKRPGAGTPLSERTLDGRTATSQEADKEEAKTAQATRASDPPDGHHLHEEDAQSSSGTDKEHSLSALGQSPAKEPNPNEHVGEHRSRAGRASLDGPPSRQLHSKNVLFIAGLGARGRTEFFQHVVEHMASLRDPSGDPLLSVCTFDNRGIGGTTVPQKRRQYSTKAMADDTFALLDHLGWPVVHVVGLSLGGMIACKMAAKHPERIASMTLLGTTSSGWHMLAAVSTQPVLASVAGGGPLKWKVPANLRYNFTEEYLQEKVDGDKTRLQVLTENTYKAIEEKNTEKFLAEGQSTVGREGHLAAVFKHRMLKKELEAIRRGNVPCQVVVGRHDGLAWPHFSSRLAEELRCTFIVLEAAHAGIMIEAIDTVVPLLETTVLGNAQSNALHIKQLGAATNETVLRNESYAREFASSFAPGRVSFNRGKSNELRPTKSASILRSKSAT